MTPASRIAHPSANNLSAMALQVEQQPSRGQSFAASNISGQPPPGSFSSDMRSVMSSSRADSSNPRPDLSMHPSYGGSGVNLPAMTSGSAANNDDDDSARARSEQRLAELQDQIDKEMKMKMGSENMLEALSAKSAKATRDQRTRIEQELKSSHIKIARLRSDLQTEELRAKASQNEQVARHSFMSGVFGLGGSGPGRPPSRAQTGYGGVDGEDDEDDEPDPESESPTFVLEQILRELEVEDEPSSHYVNHANKLVDLFKRHPTLKYDLAWEDFGLRIQGMLLSDTREVVAAGYRMMRTAITDRRSLQTMRTLHTDYLVILSLVKDNKANVEREQALKFIRAFLDVKDGVREISRAVVRIIVAIAEHSEDKLKAISVLTLAEILAREPTLLVEAGGMGTLTDALGDGSYHAAQSLTGAFLYLLDVPSRRRFLKSGLELQMPFASFTESPVGHVHEGRLKVNAKTIATLLKSWPGLMTLAMNDFLAIKSLMASLYIPIDQVRDILLDLLINILGIKPPSWGSSYLAGRRLTTYARVTNLKAQTMPSATSAPAADSDDRMDLVDHFTAVVLGVLLHSGLLEALLHVEEGPTSELLKRKTTLVLGEVLRLSNELLPESWSQRMQVLPNLLKTASTFSKKEDRFIATGTIYQVDSVNRTLYRSTSTAVHHSRPALMGKEKLNATELANSQLASNVDEAHFRALMIDSGVLSSAKYSKWRWQLILSIIDGPLLNPKRLDEAIKTTKWAQRMLSFYQPFKRRFCEIRNTKPNQRYVRIGCAFLNAMLQNPEGVKTLADSKFIRQLAECLSHYDRASGFTSIDPLFTPERIMENLDAGYFALLGTLTKSHRGLQILERWRYFNILYHIIELPGRDDLIMLLLTNMDYTIDSHVRIMLSKAMTSCSKDVRIFATRLLRKYATQQLPYYSDPEDKDSKRSSAEWAIKLLATQLYDPEIEVCEVAVKILEEASNQRHALEYVVQCRPALDHLGEIGAPLLLRFLSTSVGYHYLDGLDYISREMDDWFLGRNERYVATVEASLQRAMSDFSEKQSNSNPRNLTAMSFDETVESQDYGPVPTHFYRELARTKEGCRLLEDKGHFDEFVATICDLDMANDDAETILKVKGCLWAVGNVGSMTLGSPFLEKSDVVKDIVRIAEESCVMSLRGTAVFVLGLISRSMHGQEFLYECGWDGAVNFRGESMGFCMPLRFERLFSIKPWAAHDPNGIKLTTRAPPSTFTTAPTTRTHRADTKTSATSAVSTAFTEPLDTDPFTSRILQLVTDLGNTVLAKRAASDLHAIKSRKAAQFQDPACFKKVMRVLERHHFRLPVCRFVIDLFDRRVLRRVVLEEDEGEFGEEVNEDRTGEERRSKVANVAPILQLKLKRDEDGGGSEDDKGG